MTTQRRRPGATSYQQSAQRSRAQLLAVQAATSRKLAAEYRAMRARLQPHLDALVAAYGKELARVRALPVEEGAPPHTVSPLWLNTHGSGWPHLSLLLSHEAHAFGQRALAITRGAKAEAAGIGEEGAQAMMRAALAPIQHVLPARAKRLRRPQG